MSEPHYTDENWFLRFSGDGETAIIATTDGIPIVEAKKSWVPPRNAANPHWNRVQGQFADNMRLIASARNSVRVLKLIASREYAKADIVRMAEEALEIAEPPLFNVLHDGAVKHTGTHNDCFVYILQHQSQSVDYALKWGGWQIVAA